MPVGYSVPMLVIVSTPTSYFPKRGIALPTSSNIFDALHDIYPPNAFRGDTYRSICVGTRLEFGSNVLDRNGHQDYPIYHTNNALRGYIVRDHQAIWEMYDL